MIADIKPITSNIFTGTRQATTYAIRNDLHKHNNFSNNAKEAARISLGMKTDSQIKDERNKAKPVTPIDVMSTRTIKPRSTVFREAVETILENTTYLKPVIDPYNSKIKKKSTVDLKDRNKLYKPDPIKQPTTTMQKPRKVRTYVYKDVNHAPVPQPVDSYARKLELQPKLPVGS